MAVKPIRIKNSKYAIPKKVEKPGLSSITLDDSEVF